MDKTSLVSLAEKIRELQGQDRFKKGTHAQNLETCSILLGFNNFHHYKKVLAARNRLDPKKREIHLCLDAGLAAQKGLCLIEWGGKERAVSADEFLTLFVQEIPKILKYVALEPKHPEWDHLEQLYEKAKAHFDNFFPYIQKGAENGEWPLNLKSLLYFSTWEGLSRLRQSKLSEGLKNELAVHLKPWHSSYAHAEDGNKNTYKAVEHYWGRAFRKLDDFNPREETTVNREEYGPLSRGLFLNQPIKIPKNMTVIKVFAASFKEYDLRVTLDKWDHDEPDFLKELKLWASVEEPHRASKSSLTVVHERALGVITD